MGEGGKFLNCQTSSSRADKTIGRSLSSLGTSKFASWLKSRSSVDIYQIKKNITICSASRAPLFFFYPQPRYKGNDVIECSCDIYKCWPKNGGTMDLTLSSPACERWSLLTAICKVFRRAAAIYHPSVVSPPPCSRKLLLQHPHGIWVREWRVHQLPTNLRRRGPLQG